MLIIFQAAKNLGTDESEFNRILCLRSFPQLCAMFDNYRIRYNKEIEAIIKSETSGYLEEGYLALGRDIVIIIMIIII